MNFFIVNIKKSFLFYIITIVSFSFLSLICQKDLDIKTEQKSETKKSFKTYCNEKVKLVKNKFNNALNWIENNPKMSISVALNIILSGIIIYLITQDKNKFAKDNLFNIKIDKDSPTYTQDLEKLMNLFHEELNKSYKFFKVLFSKCNISERYAIENKLKTNPELAWYIRKFYPKTK